MAKTAAKPAPATRSDQLLVETIRAFGPVVDEIGAERITGFSKFAFRKWRQLGTGPAYRKVNGRSIRYRTDDLLRFVAAVA